MSAMQLISLKLQLGLHPNDSVHPDELMKMWQAMRRQVTSARLRLRTAPVSPGNFKRETGGR